MSENLWNKIRQALLCLSPCGPTAICRNTPLYQKQPITARRMVLALSAMLVYVLQLCLPQKNNLVL